WCGYSIDSDIIPFTSTCEVEELMIIIRVTSILRCVLTSINPDVNSSPPRRVPVVRRNLPDLNIPIRVRYSRDYVRAVHGWQRKARRQKDRQATPTKPVVRIIC